MVFRRVWATALLVLGGLVIYACVMTGNWWGWENYISDNLPDPGRTLVGEYPAIAWAELVLFAAAVVTLIARPRSAKPVVGASLATFGILLTLVAANVNPPSNRPQTILPFTEWPLTNAWAGVLVVWAFVVVTLVLFSLNRASPDSSDG